MREEIEIGSVELKDGPNNDCSCSHTGSDYDGFCERQQSSTNITMLLIGISMVVLALGSYFIR